MPEQTLARARLAGLEAVTLFNRPVFHAYPELSAVLRQRLGASAASALAQPIESGDELIWTTGLPERGRAWTELSAEERAAFEPRRQETGAALRQLAAQLRSPGANNRDGALGQVLEACLTVPGPDCLFVCGDNLVLTKWGFRGEHGAIAPFGAEPPVVPTVATPAPRNLRWLALLPLLLLLIGGGWWFLSATEQPDSLPEPVPPPPVVSPPPPPPPPPAPAPAPPEPAPPPAPPPPPPPPPPPTPPPPPAPPPPPTPPPPPAPPPPPPAPKADLPKSAWDNHDLSILEGCWILGHEVPAMLLDMFGRPREKGITRAGRLCLDKNGHGRWTEASDFPSGHLTCRAQVTARFGPNGDLKVDRPRSPCDGPGRYWVAGELQCERRDDQRADCVSVEARGKGNMEFRRAR